MKKKKRFWISPLIIIIGLIFFAGFCQKEDDDDASGAITDKDGNVYTSVTIGTQIWMVENLKTTKYNDGTDIPLVTIDEAWTDLAYDHTEGYCWYDNNAANKADYGALYNWYAVKTGKLCPTGWHVPSHDEWTTLANHLGGENVAGAKLKETGNSHWIAPFNDDATNETGFSARPGGYRDLYGLFHWIGERGIWWTSTETGVAYNDVWYWCMYVGTSALTGFDYTGNYSVSSSGCAVRCIKD